MTYRAYLGRNRRDASRVYVEIRLSQSDRSQTTIEHVTADHTDRLSIMGCVVEKGRSQVSSAGQIDPDILRHLLPERGRWTIRELGILADIWERWHLNDMRAACAHQSPPFGLDLTPACPETGYRYGSAWLYEPLPDDVRAEIVRLMSLPTGKVPDYV